MIDVLLLIFLGTIGLYALYHSQIRDEIIAQFQEDWSIIKKDWEEREKEKRKTKKNKKS